MRFINEQLDDTKEFEFDDPTEDFQNYDKRKEKGDKVIIDENFNEELEISLYDICF